MNQKRRGIITDRIVRRAAEARGLGIPVDITAAQTNVPVVPLRKAVSAFMKKLSETNMKQKTKEKH